MGLTVILGMVGALLLAIGAACLGNDGDSKGGGVTVVIGMVLLAVMFSLIGWLPGTPLKNIEPGTYEVVGANLVTSDLSNNEGYSTNDLIETVHMTIWIQADRGRMETRYFRPDKEAFARSELLTPENLRKVKKIKVTKANGFKKIELIMKSSLKALPLVVK